MRLIIVNLAALALAGPASAAEVRPGGALDVTISGFVRFLAAYGDLEDKRNLNCFPECNSYDFRNDTEVHVLLRGVHDATGVEYGGTIEFEADTNRTENTDETWIYVRGGFGELRFGDTDSPANAMRVGAETVAVGTGGLDGTVVDLDQPVLLEFFPTSEDNTKLIYFSPVAGGLQLGIGYTPDVNTAANAGKGDHLAVESPDPNDEITAGLSYTGSLGGLNFRSSLLGIVDPHNAADTYGTYVGAAIDYGDFSLAGGAGLRRFDFLFAGLFDENDVNRRFFNIGAAYDFGRVATSVNYGYSMTDRGNAHELRADALVFGLEVGLLPGLVLSTEAGYFRIEGVGDERGGPMDDPDALTNLNEDDTHAWVGVTRLALSF